MIDGKASALRRALKSHKVGRGKRYRPRLKARVVEYARARRAAGVSWVRVGTELGLTFETVRRWCGSDETRVSRAMRAVEVVAEGGVLAIVSPSGLRVEGVTVADVIAVLRAGG